MKIFVTDLQNGFIRIFCVASLIFFSGGFISVLSNSKTEDEGGILIQAIFAIIYLITAALLLKDPFRTVEIFLRDKALLLLLFLALASVLWSLDFLISFKRGIALFGTILFGVLLVKKFTLRSFLELLGYTFLIVIVLSFMFVLFLPDFGLDVAPHEGAWRGIYHQKNILGRVMATAIIVFYVLAEVNRKWTWLAIVGSLLAIILIIMAESTTTFVILFCVFLLIPLLNLVKKSKKKRKLTLFLYLIVLLTVLILLTSNTSLVLEYFGKDFTFSGRTFLWYLTIESILDNPILGFGYNVFWEVSEGPGNSIKNVLNWDPNHAHNGFLELALDLGIVALVIFAITFIKSIRKTVFLFKCYDSKIFYFPILFLSIFFIYNMTQSLVLARNNIYWVLYIVVSLYIFKGQINIKLVKKIVG